MTAPRFIDVSGVGNSGKGAVVDLLREIEGIWTPEYWFEFDFLRVPGGLIDFRHALVENWSPIRSHAAYFSFLDIVHKMGCDPRWWDLQGLLTSTSQRYDKRFKGRFNELAADFANRFVVGSYRAEWPYDSLHETAPARLWRKLLRRMGRRQQSARQVMLLDGTDFDNNAHAFLTDLFSGIVEEGNRFIALNNGFEPFNPKPYLDMLSGARQIIVTRDPRDIYVSGLNAHRVQEEDQRLQAFDNDGMNKSFLATDDLDLFVKRYRLYSENLYRKADPRVLVVSFESLVLKYDETVDRILTFLEIERSAHLRPWTRLKPNESAKNVGIWKQYSKREETAYIAENLAESLVNC